MKELKIHSLNGITLVKKALKFLKENTPEIPPYEFSNKKSKLGDNLICDFIVGKDNKVLGFSVY